MTLTELVIKRPSLVVVIFAVLSVLGLGTFSLLGYELLPSMNWPVITIQTTYPGASPSEVENSVTKKVEDAISSLGSIKTIRSTSLEGASFVIVQFAQGTDTDLRVQEAQRRIGNIKTQFPDDADDPVINKLNPNELPVLTLGVTSTMNPREFYTLVEDQLVPTISSVEGVGQIILVGGERREVRVFVNDERLKAYNISLGQVAQMVNAFNVDFPTGKVKGNDNELIVRVAGKFSSIEQLRNLVVASTPKGDVRLRDVADITDGTRDMESLNRINGRPSIGMLIVKQNDANAVAVSKLGRAELARLEQLYANINLKFEVGNDSSTYTLEAANAVGHDLLIAVFLVAAVMLLFLHSFRNSLIIMVAIPASLISVFIAMYVLDYTLNLMTLLGLSLVIGILVDDSIVVLENIYRHLEMGKDSRTAALDGRNEIGFTAMSITLVDVVVFLPLAFVGGIIGNIMGEFAIVVVVSTLMSLFVSFTVTPVLASRFSRLEHPNPNTLGGRFILAFERGFNSIIDWYGNSLQWALRHKIIIGVGTFMIFLSSCSLVIMGYIGGDFIAKSDRGEFVLKIETPEDATIEETNRIVQEVERRLAQYPEVVRVITSVGQTQDGFVKTVANNQADLTVLLVPRDKRSRTTDQFSLDIKRDLSNIPGAKFRASPVGFLGTADEAPVQIVVTGSNYADVLTGANQVLAAVASTRGASDARLSSKEGKPEARVDIDREKLSQFGLSIAEIGLTLRTALTGNDDSKYRDNNKDYIIRVQLDNFDRTNIDNIRRLSFYSPKLGKMVQLEQFADVYQAVGPNRLERYNRETSIQINSQIIGRPGGDFTAEVDKKMEEIKLPDGVRFTYEGNRKNQDESGASMVIAFFASILFVYLIMVGLYDSYIYPFVVLFSIPVAVVGALYALALTGKILDIFSALGIIMLSGLVAKNAILLVDFANHQKENGMKSFDALIEAGRERLRPIVMTTAAMVLGMLPIALASGAGSEWKNGLAWALIGGLTSSMFLTLFVVPVVYLTVDNFKAWFGRRFSARSRSVAAVNAGETISNTH